MSWTRRIFISHRWSYDEYDKIKNWLDTAPYYSFADCSISVDKKLEGLNNIKLKEAIAEHIRQCSVFIVPTAMYAAHSEWMQFEIDTAVAMNKPILAIIIILKFLLFPLLVIKRKSYPQLLYFDIQNKIV